MLLVIALAGLAATQEKAPTPRIDLFGASVATLPDLDHGGQPDLAIGDPSWSDSDRKRGRVWIVSMETGRAIRTIEPGSTGRNFGWTLCALGDIGGRMAHGQQVLLRGRP
jgi:hypothetical protein